MAIEIDLTHTQFGVPFIGAYFRIINISISRHGEKNHIVQIDIAGYATKPDGEGVRDIDFRRYYAPFADVDSWEGGSFIAKCYAWIMSQQDMLGAIAV